jgi:hypothetical protein
MHGARLEIPGIRKIPAHYREVGPSYRARSPEETLKWLEVKEHSMQKKCQSIKFIYTQYIGQDLYDQGA